MTFLIWFRFNILGEKICPLCGSELVTESGWEGCNLRYNCHDCNNVVWVDWV